MKRRELQMGAWVLVAVALPFVGIALNQVLTVRRQQRRPEYRSELQLRGRFISIKPKDGKVLMVPGSSFKIVNMNHHLNSTFYTMSLTKNHYWEKPMVVGEGFRFGYFDGSQRHEYLIAQIHQDGVAITYKADNMPPPVPKNGMPPGPPKLDLNVVWK